jgi:hypothetical protein
MSATPWSDTVVLLGMFAFVAFIIWVVRDKL